MADQKVTGHIVCLAILGYFVYTWVKAPENAQKAQIMHQVEMKYAARKEFDTFMNADFTILNHSAYNIKDVKITCEHSAPSGTHIDSNTRTIYQMIPAGQSKTIRNFDMGWMDSQVASTNCVIEDMEIIKADPPANTSANTAANIRDAAIRDARIRAVANSRILAHNTCPRADTFALWMAVQGTRADCRGSVTSWQPTP